MKESVQKNNHSFWKMDRIKYLVLIIFIFNTVLTSELPKLRQDEFGDNPFSFKRKKSTGSEYEVNPHSLYYNKNHQNKISIKPDIFGDINKHDKLQTNKTNESCQEQLNNIIKQKNYEVKYKDYYKRLIKFLLIQSVFAEENGVVYGKIGIHATIEEFNILRNFDNISVQAIDKILNKIIVKHKESLPITISTFFISVLNFIIDYKLLLYALFACLLIISVTLKYCASGISMITLLVILCSWVITHISMVKDKNNEFKTLKLIHTHMPSSCAPETQYWYEKQWLFRLIFSTSTETDCKKFIDAQMPSSSYLEVTPLDSLLKMIYVAFIEGFSAYGMALRKFSSNFTSDMNWFSAHYTQLLILGFQSLIPLFVIFLIITKFSIFNLLTSIIFRRNSTSVPNRIENISKRSHIDNKYLKEKKRGKKISQTSDQSETEDDHLIIIKKSKKRKKASTISIKCIQNKIAKDSSNTDLSNLEDSDENMKVMVKPRKVNKVKEVLLNNEKEESKMTSQISTEIQQQCEN